MELKLQRISNWWMSLGLREQRSLLIGAIFLVLFFSYSFVWKPIQDQSVNLRKKIVEQEKTLQWMQHMDAKLITASRHSGRQAQSIPSPVVLLGLLQKEIENADLAQSLTQLKQSSNEMLEMHFQKVSFDALIKLFIRMKQRYAIEIDHITLTALSVAGTVNADLTLAIHQT